MKKIFLLAIGLFGLIVTTEAQDNVMIMYNYDGTYTQYYIDDVENVTYYVYPWEKIGVGTYYSNVFGLMSGEELWKSSDNASQWEIKDFLEDDCPLIFTYDESTGKMHIPKQNTGHYAIQLVGSSSYQGYLWVEEANDFVDENGYKYDPVRENVDEYSYYDAENDVFYFAIAYYLDAGSSYVVYGYTGYDRDYDTYKVGDYYDRGHGKKNATKRNVPNVKMYPSDGTMEVIENK